MPHLKPGRSLRFAFLPEGLDPDDLVRASGREAVEAVLARARPLVDVLWEREADVQPLDTPERRAALERRLGDLVKNIADESVRRHYTNAIAERLQIFTPVAPAPMPYQRRGGGRGQGPADRRPRGGFRAEPMRASSSLRQSSQFSGSRLKVREAALLVALIRHPHLLDRHAETLSEVELTAPELDRLRFAALDAASHGEAENAEMLEGALARAGLSAAWRGPRPHFRQDCGGPMPARTTSTPKPASFIASPCTRRRMRYIRSCARLRPCWGGT